MATVNFTAGVDRTSANLGSESSRSLPSRRLAIVPLWSSPAIFICRRNLRSFRRFGCNARASGPRCFASRCRRLPLTYSPPRIGSRLRARADEEQVFESVERLPIGSIASTSDRLARVALVRSQPRSPWHARGATALPWLRRLVLTAIAVGGVVGATYLAVTIGYRTSPAGVSSVAYLSPFFAAGSPFCAAVFMVYFATASATQWPSSGMILSP